MSNWRRRAIRCCCVLSLFLLLLSPVRARAPGDVEAEFEHRYSVWRQWLHDNGRFWRMDARRAFDNEPYRQIVALGVEALPCILKKGQKDHFVGGAAGDISKFRWHIVRVGVPPQRVWHVEEFPDIRHDKRPPDARQVWRRWWKEARKITPKLFEKRYAEWKEAEAKGDDEETEKRCQRLKDLGLPALPSIMKKLEEGDEDLLPVVSYLTDNAVNEAVKDGLDGPKCLKWWAENKEKWTIPFDAYDPDRDDRPDAS